MIGCGAEVMGYRFVVPLLAHVNLLLVLYGGAALATAARLKWDPSTYIALRELFPSEYVALAVGATAAGIVMLLLPHLGSAGLHASRNTTRRILLILYAGVMSLLVLGELVLGVWLSLRLQQWLDSQAAQQLQEALELREYLKPLLQYFGRWHPLPQRIDKLIQEAEQDLPRNLYVMGAALLLLVILQPLAIVLALCASRQRAIVAANTAAVAKRNYRAWSVAAHCVTFVVKIYYREKPRWSPIEVS